MTYQAGQGAGWGLFRDNLSQSGGFGREGNTGLMKVNQDLVGDSSRHVRRCPPQIQPPILGGLAAPSQMHSQPYNECKLGVEPTPPPPTLGCPARVGSDHIGPVQKSEVFHGELREAPSPSQDTHLHWPSLGEGALGSLWLQLLAPRQASSFPFWDRTWPGRYTDQSRHCLGIPPSGNDLRVTGPSLS